jgi:DNA-binding CsgD family transcriptional regulator
MRRGKLLGLRRSVTVLEAVSRKRALLTLRERDCLVLSGKGHSEKQVAHQLAISPNTVRVHIENIKRKLGAANKTHAIVLSLLRGETDLTDFETGEAYASAQQLRPVHRAT